MLQIHYIRENKELVLEGLSKRYFEQALQLVEQVLEIDEKRRKTQTELDNLLAESNKNAKEIGNLYKQGKREEAEKMKAKGVEFKGKEKQVKEMLRDYETEMQDILVLIPNVPHPDIPAGRNENDNVEILRVGEVPTLDKNAKPHWELIQDLDIIDFELGNKLTGAGFPVYKGKGAKLQRALINFFLKEAEKQGYTEIQPPLLVNQASGFATGQLPDKDGQMYFAERDGFYLIPTAEVPITNIYRDVILEEKQFPIKNVGYTQCFRREAGSWGADVRGLNRLHQFDKVEIVQIVHPEKSYEVLEEMRSYVTSLLEKLELPYRILKLCGGDTGFTSAFTYDMEVFSAAQQRWLEVSSTSNFETYQANRLKLRFRSKENKKTALAHTLNGSALALPRIVAALLENNQKNGEIHLPKVLWEFTGFEKI